MKTEAERCRPNLADLCQAIDAGLLPAEQWGSVFIIRHRDLIKFAGAFADASANRPAADDADRRWPNPHFSSLAGARVPAARAPFRAR